MNQEALELALIAHNADFIKSESMVYLLFGDGELCLTKAGDLFGCRSLHMILPAKLAKENTYPFPFAYGSYPCIVLKDEGDADIIRRAM